MRLLGGWNLWFFHKWRRVIVEKDYDQVPLKSYFKWLFTALFCSVHMLVVCFMYKPYFTEERVSSKMFQEVKLFSRCSLLITFCPLLVTFCSFLVNFCSLLVTFYLLLVTFCSLLVTFCSLLVTFCSLLVTFCLLLVIFYSLLNKKCLRIFFE